MDGGGSQTFGDPPEEPGAGRPADTGASEGVAPFGDPDWPDELPMRGWVAPDDRLWLHPSELAKRAAGGGSPHSGHVRSRSSAGAVGAVGAAAVAAAVVAVFALSNAGAPISPTLGPGGSPGVPAVSAAAATVTSLATEAPAVPGPGTDARIMQRVRASLVQLIGTRSGSPAAVTAAVMPGGSVAVTAASVVAGMTGLEAVTFDGRKVPAHLVANDPYAGVALVDLGATLPPAAFADEPVWPGESAYEACLCGGQPAGASGSMQSQPATVVSVGTAATMEDGQPLLDTIGAAPALGQPAAGGVLIDGAGRVIGISEGVLPDQLDAEAGSAAPPASVFVPSSLALAVANRMVGTAPMTHGWLGITAANAPGGECGAQVVSVMPGSPAAAARITVGELVVAVDDRAVCSLADLQERLYVTDPGQQVRLDVESATGTHTVSAWLTPLPAAR